VAVTEVATGAVRTAPADSEGVFRFPALPQGRYSLKVELDGFTPVTMTDISLAPAEVRNLGRLQLKVGRQTESVTVTAAATPVQTATSSRYGTVTADQLTNIQIKGRDIYGFMALVPGVMDTNLNRAFTTWTSMRDVTINGAPVTSKNIVVDGVSVVDEGGDGNAFVNPNIDAVGEVQVIANGFTAENGRNNGGLIIMTTKSGTSSFKGSGWYNARRKEWKSEAYFDKKEGNPKPLYHVNISGYSIGGPVIIPKVVNSGRLFFFFSQEFTDDLRAAGVTRANLPTALERMGDFSQTRTGNANGPGQGSLNVITDYRTGLPFPGNRIDPKDFHPMGARLLGLLPMPNDIHNQANNQYNAANSTFDTKPEHSRVSNTLRLDAVLNDRIRGSFKFTRDIENNLNNNALYIGSPYTVNNYVPGWIWSASSTQVLSSSMVNEMTVGYGHNNYGFRMEGDFDYTTLYRSAFGFDPPRLRPFSEVDGPPRLIEPQVQEWPYMPILGFSGGNRTGYASFQTGSLPLPRANLNDRWSFQDDLSLTRGRHNFKFGFYTEWTLKTEPGVPNYMGNYDFGHNAQNPFSSGNGYANALLGVFNTYTENTNRFDKRRQHWQTEGYLQDSWRVTPRFTLDYGVRLTHSGAFYDTNNSTAGFFAEDWNPAQAPLLYRPFCTTPNYVGTATCSAANQRAIDPRFPNVLLPSANIGNLIPGTGSQINGMRVNGVPGKNPGEYFSYTPLVVAPRAGFAWDINGDGKMALRASAGTFYNYPRPNQSLGNTAWDGFVGLPPVSFSRQIRWAKIDDVATYAGTFVEQPINVQMGRGEVRPLDLSHNFNVTFQRDVGFNTTAEVAFVANYSWTAGRGEDINRPLNNLYLLGDPSRMFNGNALSTNFLRTVYPGMGSVTRFFTRDERDINAQTLKYHSMQLSVQRRLTRGLQMGLAYTLAKGEGWTGWSQDILDADPTGGLNRLLNYGPTNVDRRHNLVVNYSYQIPTPLPNVPVVRWILGDWQVSGVTRYLSGTATGPNCTTNNTGIANTNPTLTPGASANCVYTGAGLYDVTRVDGVPEEDQPHFNPAAFAFRSRSARRWGTSATCPMASCVIRPGKTGT
jgi:hypothetical protein